MCRDYGHERWAGRDYGAFSDCRKYTIGTAGSALSIDAVTDAFFRDFFRSCCSFGSPALAVDQVTLAARRQGSWKSPARCWSRPRTAVCCCWPATACLWLIPPDEQVEHTTRRLALCAAYARRDEQTAAGRTAAGVQSPSHDALPDLLRHVAGLCPMVRIAVRAALPGVHQFLDPQGIRSDRAASSRWWPSCLPTSSRT